jgi:hypothetical protein
VTLKLTLCGQNQSWTLKPNRSYVVGNYSDCDIDLANPNYKSQSYLKLWFDAAQGGWLVAAAEEHIDWLYQDQRLDQAKIMEQATIKVGDLAEFLVLPQLEDAAYASAAPSSFYATSDTQRQGFRETILPSSSPLTNPIPSNSHHRSNEVMNPTLMGQIALRVDPGLLYDGTRLNKHPEDGAGVLLAMIPAFAECPTALSHNYKVGKTLAQSVRSQLYGEVIGAVQSEALGDSKLKLLQYNQSKYHSERMFVRVTKDISDGARATVLARFLSDGDYLYIALSSYMLSRIDGWKVFRRALMTLLMAALGSGFPLLLANFLTIAEFPVLSLIGFFALPLLLWLDVIRRFRFESSWKLAFRQTFPRLNEISLFEVDDTWLFIKSELHLSVDAISRVLERNNLPTETLDRFQEALNVTTINNFDNRVDNRNIDNRVDSRRIDNRVDNSISNDGGSLSIEGGVSVQSNQNISQ